ncbi:MAG: UbiA-like polyprenyltransferase [Acidobacteriota bacterium]
MPLTIRSPGRLEETLRMVRFSHTLFALPFALTGMILAARGLPPGRVFLWIVAAMVGARTAAMAFNRLVDRRFDTANPRTAARTLPAGRLTPAFAWGVFASASLLFLIAAWQLNGLALALAPLALVILCGYSFTKRFTPWTHLFLGLSLAGAPLGAWIAVRAGVSTEAFLLSGAVLFWTAGFDVIYALQDADSDRSLGLHSLPAWLGPAAALRWARAFHFLAGVLLFFTGHAARLGLFYYTGMVLSLILLTAEHLLVGPRDLSRLPIAFFRLNVAVGLSLLLCTSLDLLLA